MSLYIFSFEGLTLELITDVLSMLELLLRATELDRPEKLGNTGIVPGIGPLADDRVELLNDAIVFSQ